MGRPFALLLIFAACKASDVRPADAGVDRFTRDVAPALDTQGTTLSIHFSIQGCPFLDQGTFTCEGRAPLTLQFVPIASASLTKFQWDFGDSSGFEPETTPSHTYSLPGKYTVRLVGTGVGGNVVSHEAKDMVVVTANATGAPCQASNQCEQGLACLSPQASSPWRGPPLGLCTASCQIQDCGEGEVCADLAPVTPAAENREAWQGRFCLNSCAVDQDCPPLLRCRTLPPYPASSTWIRACFSGFPVDLGASCVDEKNQPRNDLCSGGLCAALGSKGLCAKDCSKDPCPTGSGCATFGNGQQLCLRECSLAARCDADPLLACNTVGEGGLGFRLKPLANQNATYCAPKPCSNDDGCGDLGLCQNPTDNGHCVPR